VRVETLTGHLVVARRTAATLTLLVGSAVAVAAQDAPPSLRAARLPAAIVIDGRLSETAWEAADAIENFRQTDPVEGAAASARTKVQVLADSKSIVIGVTCEEPDPSSIVSFSVRRDAVLDAEDHVRLVLGPFADGRSGYVFAVNPSGARYDGLINPGGETENADWDGIWEAATARLPDGWSAEIRIPVQSIAFKPGLHEWHFNVERRIQRRFETDRWAAPNRQYRLTQTSRAGLLTDLPDFDLGLGLTVRPAVTTGAGVPAADASHRRLRPRTCSTDVLRGRAVAGDGLVRALGELSNLLGPINWRFRSGDRVEFNANPTGERLIAPFEVSPGVVIPPGSYEWRQYRLEAGTAQKRRFYAQVTWWFGGFYDGSIDQFQWTGAWNPKPIVTVEFSGERNIGRLPAGDFTQSIVGTRLRLNFSPDLSLSSYLQYDSETDSVGTNTRLRWTFRPVGDLFVVYNHNIRSIVDRWRLDSNQLPVKVQYAWRT
jgi:hypothetical protein